MKKTVFLPVLTLTGGAAAFFLRLMQVRTGFEAATGLPVRGNLWAYLLVAFLAALTALFLLLSRCLPDEKETPPAAFTDAFSTRRAGLLTLPVAGVFLLGISGALDVLSGAGIGEWPSGLGDYTLFAVTQVSVSAPSSRTLLVQGLASLLTAACLFPAVTACRRPAARESVPQRELRSGLLLVPVVCLVVRLVLVYRTNSIDPSLAAYYVELLALVLLTLGFYRLSSFGYQAGRTRRFAVYAMAAVTLCIASLANVHSLAELLFYAGGALTLLGFLLVRLNTPAVTANSN